MAGMLSPSPSSMPSCTGSETEEARGASASLRCRHVRIRSRCWRAPGRLASIVPCAIKCGAIVTMPLLSPRFEAPPYVLASAGSACGAIQTEAAVQVVDLVPREIRQTIAIRCPETTAADVRRQWRFPAAQLLLRPQCLLLPVSSSLFKHQGGFVGFFSYFSAASIECHIPPLPDILRV